MIRKHVFLIATMASALAAQAHANTLRNANFDEAARGGPPPTTIGSADNLGGWSAAADWSTWAREPGGTVWTELVPNDHGRAGNMLHVIVHRGSGIVQVIQAQYTGPATAYSCAWVKVVSGRAGIGLGNGGDTHLDAVSTGTGVWEWLSAVNGVSPANEFIVYAAADDAEFYVDRAVVSENPNECPPGGVPVKWARPETYVKPYPFPWLLHPQYAPDRRKTRKQAPPATSPLQQAPAQQKTPQ
jgi:hypothetical protein